MSAVPTNVVPFDAPGAARATDRALREVLIEGRGVSKTYRTREGEVETLKPLDFDIRAGEFVSVVGPSGCGKSTLMKMVAGLLPITGGDLRLAGHTVKGPQTDVGIVFQNALLLPWRRVIDNILLQAEIRRMPMAAARRRAEELMAMAGLQGFEHKYPWQLSGGMQQRVAILRALLHDPPVLLMDEPFGALDDFTRREMSEELLRIYAEQQCSVFFVTHSLPEAVLLSDHIVVLKPRPGRVQAIIDIALPRPRSANVRSSSEFRRYLDQLEEMIFGDGHA